MGATSLIVGQRLKMTIEQFAVLALYNGHTDPLIHLSEIMGVTPVNEDTEVHDIIDHLIKVAESEDDTYFHTIAPKLIEFCYI
jgi:hypothetical protein